MQIVIFAKNKRDGIKIDKFLFEYRKKKLPQFWPILNFRRNAIIIKKNLSQIVKFLKRHYVQR